MTNLHRSLCILTICSAESTLWLAGRATAQQAAVYYDDGVNAYFRGHTCDAESHLSSAIEANSQDPRAYYFRALSLLRQGRTDLARGDMLTGATLEAQQPNRYAIGSALERIQGPQRLMLEEFRRHARQAAAPAVSVPTTTGAPAPDRTFREGEADVVREKKFVPLEELLRPEGPRAIAVEPPSATPPAVPPQPGTPAVAPDTQPESPPATPMPEKDPFADDNAQAAPSATPPAPPPTPPQDAPKPATPPPVEDVNPFGG